MKIQSVPVKHLMVKSSLPASDYVINPYIGCTHRCRYCYACFMKRFTNHKEEWGTFVDVKEGPRLKIPKNIFQKTILISSVTDPYQPIEKTYGSTRAILEQLKETTGKIEILTKSHLVTRDMDLFLQFPQIRIGISMNTLDDSFRKDMEPGASSIPQRLEALRQLSKHGLSTYLFLSPIFPEITDIRSLVHETAPYVEEICFENLNLRGAQVSQILSYISKKYPEHLPLYHEIYREHRMTYWEEMKEMIQNLNQSYPVTFSNYFYHEKIKKKGNNEDEYTIS